MTDYLWHGDAAAIAALTTTTEIDPDTQKSVSIPKQGISIIGPRILDGIAYVNVRTDLSLSIPEGVEITGTELSAAVIGVWSDSPDDINPTP